MRRGEVWWAELPPPVGNRPVVVLTRDAVLTSIEGIVVALVTRTVRGLPTELVLGRGQGLPVRCTVPRSRLKRLMGACDAQRIEELNSAIKAALDVRRRRGTSAATRITPRAAPPRSHPSPRAARSRCARASA